LDGDGDTYGTTSSTGVSNMRKMIIMAIASFLWKKYQANKAAKTATRPTYRQ